MKELWNYQEIDMELKRVEKKVNASEYIKKVNASKDQARKAQNRMLEINTESKKIAEDIDKIVSVKTKGVELVKKYTETDTTGLSEKDVLNLANKIKPIKKNLDELISRLMSLENRMKKLLQEFENCKKQIITSKKIHDENKTLLDKLRAEIEPEVEVVRQKLQKQEKKVKPELIQKYRNLKREGIFPVLVKLQDGKNCGYCRVEQSMGKKEKLKINGFTECEQCHRIIIAD